MNIWHDGKEIDTNEDILLKKWKVNSVTGDTPAERPPYCIFNNTQKALELLKYHVDRNSTICLHTDVDVDGIGTTYELKKALENLGSHNHILLINSDKIHGIQQKQVDYFNTKYHIDLMIITDSSSNEIALIKQFNCDVLCIDHHDLLHDDLFGLCNDSQHRYVIVNNTIENKNQEQDNLWLRSKNISAFENIQHYEGDGDMSCGVVVYELLRIYCECFSNPKLIENLMLYQWAAITLITDSINTLNNRNQWYLSKTISNSETESTLRIIMEKLDKYRSRLDKSYIEYKFAPTINKAIRAGSGNKALYTIINNPEKIDDLLQFASNQQEALDKALKCEVRNTNGEVTLVKREFTTETIQLDISKLGIHRNYSGVIAGRLSGDNHKNAVVYIMEDGMCRGSFRGRYSDVDYRAFFASYKDYIYAQGHPPAFGFKLYKEDLDYLMENLKTIEPDISNKPYLTAGNMTVEEMGEYHIANIDEFKRLGYLWRLAIGNSRVISNHEINIVVKASDIELKGNTGNVYKYNVLGMECKAFSILTGKYFKVYAEYTNQVDLYIRPLE